MRNMLVLTVLLAALAVRAQRWDHNSSPYRATFTVTSHPNVEDAGYFLEVPICGIGDQDGDEVYVYDQDGKRFWNSALGVGRKNTVLVLTGPGPGVRGQPEKLLAYFGSGKNAPQRGGELLHGPIVDIRLITERPDVGDWDSAAKFFESTRRLGLVPLDTIELGHNPINTLASYVCDFRGYLYAQKPQTWQVFLVNDDAGYFFVGRDLLIDRSGKRSVHDARRGENRQPVQVTPAGTPFRVLTVNLDGPHQVVLGRWVNERKTMVIPPEGFVQSGRTEFVGMDGYGRRQCPAFVYELVSYMSLPDLELTEVRLTGYGGEKMEWVFSDGARATGPDVSRICVGTHPIRVGAKVGRATAEGEIVFNEVPDRHSQQNNIQFQHYSDLMLAEQLPRLETDVLLAYLEFLRYRERNVHCAPVAAVLVDKLDRSDGKARTEALLTLARTAARDDPDRAAAAWQAYLRTVGGDAREQLYHEYLEFELYRHRDPAAMPELIERVARVLPEDDPTLTLYRGEAAMLAGEVETAREHFGQLRRRLTASEDFQALRIQGNAMLEQHRQYLDQGFYYRAEESLRSWATISPGSIADGQYVLVRARWLRQLGWLERIPLLIDSFLVLNDLPAFLPDLEMTKALALHDLGKTDAARQLFESIAKNYPKHPVARHAQTFLN